MMKIVRFLLCCAVLLCASCIEKAEIEANRGVDIAPMEPMADFEVPVKEGRTTIVSMDGEQLAVTRNPLTILVPATALTRAGGIEVSYSDEDIFGEYAYASFWHYLSFEDTHNGDCDYNDVVLHCRVETDIPWDYTGTEQCKHVVSVQPVALGGSRRLAFGFLYLNDQGEVTQHIITEDVRRDLFNGDLSFPINTDLSKPVRKVSNKLKRVFECSTHFAQFRVVWFLANSEGRLYAASTNFGVDRKLAMIDPQGMPYGIALTSKWCYPVEKCDIRKAYPGFDTWRRTGNENDLLEDKIRNNTFYPATIRREPDGDLWDYKNE